MGTLHIRNVPDEVVGRLKQRASAAGRSLNSEVVLVLSQVDPRPKRSIDEVIESVRLRAERIRLKHPRRNDVVDDIRRARDERAEQIGSFFEDKS